MPAPDNNSSYHFIAKLLHWGFVLLLSGQFIFIWISQYALRSGREFREFGLWILDLHKAMGLLIVAIVILRLAWRKLGGLPPWAAGLAEWEKTAAHRLEGWLYKLMFAAPLTGIIYSITSGYPIKFFDVFAIPVLMEKVRPLANAVWLVHMTLAYVFIAVIALHVGFVVRRSIFEKDGYIKRMTF